MKRRRQVVKSRSLVRIRDRKVNELRREVERQVQLVNARLNSLERKHASGTWASGKLATRVKNNKTKGLLYKGKRIRLKPKMSKTSLVQLQKATKQFLDSATSTNRGIEKVKSETIKNLKDTLNLDRKKKITDQDAEEMYKMLSNKDFDRFNKAKNKEDFIGASALWSEIDYASNNNLSKDNFIERLQNLRMQDFSIDDKLAAERIYERYVI